LAFGPHLQRLPGEYSRPRHGNLKVFVWIHFSESCNSVHFPVSNHEFRQECLNLGLKLSWHFHVC
jgi:hypothetical protein